MKHAYKWIVKSLLFVLLVSTVTPVWAINEDIHFPLGANESSVTNNVYGEPGEPLIDTPGKKNKKRILEITEKRTRNSKSYLLEDGTFEMEIFTGDVHFAAEDGNFHEIRTTLVSEGELVLMNMPVSRDSAEKVKDIKNYKLNSSSQKSMEEDSSYHALQVPFEAELPKNIKKGYSIGDKNDRLTFVPVNASKSLGVTDVVYDNKVYYKNVWEHTDIELSVMSYGIKEDIIMHDPEAPNQFTFEVKGPLKDDFTTDELTILPPWLIDRNGVTRDVTMKKRVEKNKTYIDLTWDDEGLEYPVTIDPSVVPIDAVKFSYADMRSPDNKYPYNAYIGGYGTGYIESFMKFPLNSIPEGSTILSGSLVMQVRYLSSTGCYARPMQALPYGGYFDSWDPHNVSWNTRPTSYYHNPGEVKSISPSDVGKSVSWDISAMLVGKTNFNYHLPIVLQYTGGFTREHTQVQFGDGYFINMPRITVQYEAPVVVDDIPPSSPSISPTNQDYPWRSVQYFFLNKDGTDTGGSGVQKSQYRVNGGSWIDYTASVRFDKSGSYLVEARTLDNAGNASPIVSGTFRIDEHKPNNPMHQGTISRVTSDAVTLTWKAFSDPAPSSGYASTTIYVDRWDGSKWVQSAETDQNGTGMNGSYQTTDPNTLSYVYSGLTPGQKYRFSIVHKDKVGHYMTPFTWVEATTFPIPNTPRGTVVVNEDEPTGYVNLSWDPVPGATGYAVWIFNGYKYERFDVGNVTSWSTSGKYIFPSFSTVKTWGNNSRQDVFNDHLGNNVGGNFGDIWINPNFLYRKTTGTTYDTRSNYWFRVSAYNALGESTYSSPYTPTMSTNKRFYIYDDLLRLDYMFTSEGQYVDFEYDRNGNTTNITIQ